MKGIFKNPLTYILGIPILFLVIMPFITKKVTHTGKVLQHFITADKYGMAKYNTIAVFDDNMYRTLKDIGSYMVPVGGTVYYECRELK